MSNNYQKEYSIYALNRFLEDVFEIAFGDDAINKEYTMIEVVEKLRQFSDSSQDAFDLLLENYSSINDFEKKKKEFLNKWL